MPKWIVKIGIGRFMFFLLYLSIAFFAFTGNNIIDIGYFIALTIYYLRVFLYMRRKKRTVTSS